MPRGAQRDISTAQPGGFGPGRLVVAFDADTSRRVGHGRLGPLLDEAGVGDRVSLLDVPGRWGDLNGWLQGSWHTVPSDLDLALTAARSDVACSRRAEAVPEVEQAAFADRCGIDVGMDVERPMRRKG